MRPSIKKSLLAAVTCVAMLALPASALGANLTVTTTDDELDPALDQSGFCSLREAVFSIDQGSNYLGATPDCVATGDPYGTTDKVILGPGTYGLTRSPVLNPDGNQDGDLDIFKPMGIQGTGTAADTVIDANNLDRAIDVISQPTQQFLAVKKLTIVNGNTAGDGGGIRVGDADAAVALDAAAIRDSDAGNVGGGIAFDGATSSSDFEIYNSELSGNTAGDSGGGVYLFQTAAGGAQQVLYSALVGNHADQEGGAIYLEGVAGSTAEIQNSTLSGNSAGGSGGAVELGGVGPETSIEFATLTGNMIPAGVGGGAIHSSNGTAIYKGSILAGNTAAGTPSNCAGTTTVTDLGWNIESADTCGFTTGTPYFDLINTDPLLAPLAANGATTRTHGLYDASPAIDHADCDLSEGEDQRFVPRPSEFSGVFGCDVGAFEGSVGPVPPPPPPPAPLTPSVNSPAQPPVAAKRTRCKKAKKRASSSAKKCRKRKK